MEIKSNSQYFKEDVPNKHYYIDYGTIKRGTNTDVIITIEGVNHLSVAKSCQCTQPSVEVIENGVVLTIKYDNNKIGTINQFVKEKVSVNGKVEEIKFDLKGQITN